MHADAFGYLRQLLLAPGSPAGSAINLIILSLFLAGLLDNAVALFRLGRERRNLRRAREKLATAATADALGRGAAILDLLRISPTSLVGRRFEKILQLRSAGLRQSWMLRELTGDRLAGYGALARYIGAILTLLGLLGTVLGLALPSSTSRGPSIRRATSPPSRGWFGLSARPCSGCERPSPARWRVSPPRSFFRHSTMSSAGFSSGLPPILRSS